MRKKIEIRPESPTDRLAIASVHETAFGDSEAARLVDLLRERGNATISLVALSEGDLVGHIMFSPVTVETCPDSIHGLGLAPVSIRPQFQNQGIGSALIEQGLSECRRLGYDLIVVLGHPPYYPRFGFRRASAYGLTNEYGADEAFMVIELKTGALDPLNGLVKYAPEFKEVGV